MDLKHRLFERARNIQNPRLRAMLRAMHHHCQRIQTATINPRAALDVAPLITESPSSILVFMPTYAPDKTGLGAPPRPLAPVGMGTLRGRCMKQPLASPWIYLDAIDSIRAVLGPEARLVVADFRSSDEVRNVLIEHQKNANMPHYELWCSQEKESQWKAMNLVLMQKLREHPEIRYVVYTSSDIIWWQRNFLSECWFEFRRDFDAYILYPTVTRAEGDLRYQQAPGPRDEDAFAVDLCNAYIAVYNADFFRMFDNKYPDVFRNCYTESFLPLMLRAIGAKQKIVPRANCFHVKNADLWQDSDGSDYCSSREWPVYLDLRHRLMEYRKQRPLDFSALDYLKELLYRPDAYYEGARYNIYRNGITS